MNKNIELRIYELLGIKVFRKIAFKLRDLTCYPLVHNLNKEDRKKALYQCKSNYNLGRTKSLDDIKDFKHKLFYNTGMHIFGLLVCVKPMIQIIGGTASISTAIIIPICTVANLYCIALQRYNFIRINNVVKKMTPRYEEEKISIKDELRKEDSMLDEHLEKSIICHTFYKNKDFL